jgi:5-methylthioadenosine/S-adenosylhomocysteine deaminase
VTERMLLRGGCVLTLGAKTHNHPVADVLIEGDKVVEVGPGIRARDAEQVDAADTIVMPGFVDSHRHAWRSLFRNLGLGVSQADPSADPGGTFGPEDHYAATLIGLLGAVEAGITTVVDWPDVHLDEAAADAVLRAHADAGLRTVFVHDAGEGRSAPPIGEHVARLSGAAGPSTTVAVGFATLGPGEAERGAVAWTLARELGLPIHLHAGSVSSGAIVEAAKQGLLGADVTVAHCSDLDDAALDAIAASGASVSLSPSSDMASGLGSPPIQQLIDRDIRPGLGVDEERVAPGDLFAQMRAAISTQHATLFDLKLAGKAGLPRLMSTRDVIRCATVEGARVAGSRGVTGSIEPGMQADVIVLRTDRPNIFPINDPIGAVVWGMDTSNVDMVFVGGRVLMRDGVLLADVQRARDLATEARRRVAPAAGLVAGAASGGAG